MNSIQNLLRHVLLIAVASLALVAVTRVSADTSNPGTPVGTVPVPSGLNKEDVKDTIVMTLAARGWGIQEKTDEKIVGYLKHRANEATLTLIYDETRIELYCVGYEINKKTGERKKPELPNGWLNNIRNDLNKKLNQATATK